MSEPNPSVALSGWLRKRPHYAGTWNKRFFVLSSLDSTLRIFSDESEAALSSTQAAVHAQKSRKSFKPGVSSVPTPKPDIISPLFAISFSKTDILVNDPFERMVRVGTRVKEKVYVIKIWRAGKQDKLECLLTCGASNKEEAMKWKAAFLLAATNACSESVKPTIADVDALQQPQVEVVDTDPNSSSVFKTTAVGTLRSNVSTKRFFDEEEGSCWKVVDNKDGFSIEGEKEFTREFPSIRAKATIQASAKDIFDLIMDDSKRLSWDEHVQKYEVLREISENSHIVYVQLKDIWIGPMWTGARDLILLRYWRQDDDGSYVITWQSVEDPELSPPQKGFVRGKIFAMGFCISPTTTNTGTLVRIFCHADPGPPLNMLSSSVLQSWMFPFVTRLMGVKKTLEQSAAQVEQAMGLSGGGLLLEESFYATTVADVVGGVATSEKESAVVVTAEAAEEVNSLKLGSFDPAEWMETPQHTEPYTLRSKTYLTDRIKYKCTEHMFHLVAADLFKVEAPTPHCALRSDSPLWRIKQEFPGENRPVFVLQFLLPGPPFFVLALYAVAKRGVLDDPETAFAKLWTDFREGTDEYRASVFKMIPRVTQGNYMVKKTVGETPALIARKMKMNFYANKDYIECDMDLGTSAVAGSILSVVKGYATTLTVDLGLLLEGHSNDKLPEVIICGFRAVKAHMGKAKVLPPDPDPAQTQRNVDAYHAFLNHESDEE